MPELTPLYGFLVEIPSLEDKISTTKKMIAGATTSSDKQLLKMELDELIDVQSNPPLPPPRFKLTGSAKQGAAAPPATPPPQTIPFEEWKKAVGQCQVLYYKVRVREQPNLQSRTLRILNKFENVRVERETGQWVKIRGDDGGGWVLKSQGKFGPLLSPVLQLHYEHKYSPAFKFSVNKLGHIVRTSPDGASRQEDEDWGLIKRFLVTKGRRNHPHGSGSYPAPPPRGIEIVFDRASGRNYYVSLNGKHSFWTLEEAVKI